jgi:hypothetical protein
MKKNIGNTDMAIRLVFAAILFLCYFLFNLKDFTGLIVIIIAILLALTAFTRVCPLYYIFRTDTLKKEEKKPE